MVAKRETLVEGAVMTPKRDNFAALLAQKWCVGYRLDRHGALHVAVKPGRDAVARKWIAAHGLDGEVLVRAMPRLGVGGPPTRVRQGEGGA